MAGVRQKLAPGAELDLLTEDELRSALSELRNIGPVTVRPEESIHLDSAGNGTVDVYTVPAGMEFTLHRLRIDIDGADPGHTVNAANGWADILRDAVAEDFIQFAASAGGLPQVKTWSGAAGIVFRNGETVQVKITAAPTVSVNVTVKLQGTLNPIASD